MKFGATVSDIVSLGRVARTFLSFAGVGFALLASHAAQANNTTSVVRVSCIPELGLVEVETTFLRGEKGLAALESRRDFVAREYGYYEIDSLLSIREEEMSRSMLKS